MHDHATCFWQNRARLFVTLLLVGAWVSGWPQSGAGLRGAEPESTGRAAPAETLAGVDGDRPAEPHEIEVFGQDVAAAVRAQDLDRLDGLIDWQAIYERGIDGVDAPAELKSQFYEALNATSPQKILRVLMAAAENGGSFAFLGVRKFAGEPSALFRVVQPNGGLNHCDMRVRCSASGELKCIDMRTFTIGEYMSEGIRYDFRVFVATMQSTATPEVEEYSRHAEVLSAIATAVREREGARACEMIDRLPATLQQHRRVLLMKIQASMQLDDDSLLRAIDEYSERFPTDTSARLYAMQAKILKHEYDAAQLLFAEFNESIGGDAYVDALRADYYFLEGDLESARRFATAAREREADLNLANWTLVRVAVREEKFAEAVQGLDSLYDPDEPVETIAEQLSDWPELTASAEFLQWKAGRSARD